MLDTVFHKKCTALVDWCKLELKTLCPNYWNTFKYDLPSDCCAVDVEDPKFYTKVVEYINSNAPSRLGAAAAEVTKVEDTVKERLKKLHEQVLEISLHWQMRDTGWGELRSNQQRPNQRTLYFHSVWKDCLLIVF